MSCMVWVLGMGEMELERMMAGVEVAVLMVLAVVLAVLERGSLSESLSEYFTNITCMQLALVPHDTQTPGLCVTPFAS